MINEDELVDSTFEIIKMIIIGIIGLIIISALFSVGTIPVLEGRNCSLCIQEQYLSLISLGILGIIIEFITITALLITSYSKNKQGDEK